jgi:hypothetical protein
MVDYYPLRYSNRELPDPEEGDEEAVREPVVHIVINGHRQKGKSETFAVSVSITFPRTEDL